MPRLRLAPLSVALVGALILAGCSGGGSDSSTTSTTGEPCPTGPVVSGTDGITTLPVTGQIPDTCGPCKPVCSSTSSRPPNDPPVLVVTLSANVTFLGGNITVDANGTTDPDDGLAQIAVGVTTANGTMDPQFLYFAGSFRTARFNLTHAGPGNVTVVAQDRRGDTTIQTLPLFVNSRQTVSNVGPMRLAVPSLAPTDETSPTKCTGPTGQNAADGETSFAGTFHVAARATHVVATVTGGSAMIALCSPEGVAISGAATDSVTSTKGTAFSAQAGTSAYYVQAYSTAPNQAAGAVTIDVVVHYEPQP